MPSSWTKLRTLNGSQEAAFEALVCQLAAFEATASGSTFTRKGTPDAGVECYWKFPAGHEHAWQAKFFTTSPSPGQWSQIDDSVRTALDGHPLMQRYTVCMAVDRSDGRRDGTESFQDKWDERLAKWQRWAAAKSMRVEFRYWGTHEITERLAREEHRGRHFFWFNEEFFTQAWYKQHLDETIAAVGPRYTPELNVRLPIATVFEGLSRSPDFLARFQSVYGDLGKACSVGTLKDLPGVPAEPIELFVQSLAHIIQLAKDIDRPGVEGIDSRPLKQSVEEAVGAAFGIARMLRNAQATALPEVEAAEQKKQGIDKLAWARHTIDQIEEALLALKEFIEGDAARLATSPALLLVGTAGTGKTHLFSDAAVQHVNVGAPAVLFLGSHFRNEDPWKQIIEMLGLTCPREEFLGAMEAAAQLAGRRAILFLDALNEGEGRNVWETYLPAMLTCIARHPWLAIAVSVRTSYEHLVIAPGLTPLRLVRCVHTGFAENEFDALGSYCDHYGIEAPTLPILSPEFNNPLFLRCFCSGMQNQGETRVQPGVRGIAAVFSFFLDSVNAKLARGLDYDPKINLVERATMLLAGAMSASSSAIVSRERATEICEGVLPSLGFEKSLFQQLLSENVIAEAITYDPAGRRRNTISFSYERLSDHLRARDLIRAHLASGAASAPLGSESPIRKVFSDECACWEGMGLLEALAIQAPELLGKEVFELLPDLMGAHAVCEAFLESLVWRDKTMDVDRCLKYLNTHCVEDDVLHGKLLDALLTIAPNPRHPFNADFLHRNLLARPLAERDASWSTFLSEEYETKGPIQRLLDWAATKGPDAQVDDQTVMLVGQVLLWFLTTSDRYLRDRATKALVALFSNRIQSLCRVLPLFSTVNDLYVHERLYCVAYGCALRSKNGDHKRMLAQTVYDEVFKNGKPPCHILLRDYARGVIEVALRDGLMPVDFDAARSRPPYSSDWPLDIPTVDELKTYGKWEEGMPDERWALVTIYNSVMEHGDFARYVIGSDGGHLNWSTHRLTEERTPSPRERRTEFERSLTTRQRLVWDSYAKLRKFIASYRGLDASGRRVLHEADLPDEALEKLLETKANVLRRTLGIKKTQVFDTLIAPHFDESHVLRRGDNLSTDLAQRWIFKRVLDLGWTVERFGAFDRACRDFSPSGRSANKPERIGKKYQWIAYHEFLAHAADNLQFRPDNWSDHEGHYDGPWQLGLRDIDPSSLLRSTHRSVWKPHAGAWWAPERFERWSEEPDETRWLRSVDLLPKFRSLPIVTDPTTGREWLVLECNYDWEEPTPPEQERYNTRRRHIGCMLKSYLLRAVDETAFFEWGKKQHFMGRWMPESHEQTSVFMGEFFWAPAFKHFDTRNYGRGGWTNQGRSPLTCSVQVTTDQYMQEFASYDCSIDETIQLYLPASLIAERMQLCSYGGDGRYLNGDQVVVAQDPSASVAGPRALVVDRELMSEFLTTNDYRLVWTILGEKDVRGDFGRDKDWLGRMELSACVRMNGGKLEGAGIAYWIKNEPLREELGRLVI